MLIFIIAALLLSLPLLATATPEQDRQQLQNYYLDRAPAIPLNSYSADYHTPENTKLPSGSPIYIERVREGKTLLNSDFANGRSYLSCFRSNGIGVGSDYPYFDVIAGKAITLSSAINDCRIENGEEALPYDSDEMESMVTYIMSTSDRNIVNIIMPNDPAAEALFYEGKRLFFARQGQMNMACAHCHIDYADRRYGSEQIPPLMGLPLRMPRYNSRDGDLVTLHERFNHCLDYTKAKPYPLESETLQALEFYLFYVNNGLPLNTPSIK